MRKTIGLVIGLVLTVNLFGTHNRAGEITYVQTGPYAGVTEVANQLFGVMAAEMELLSTTTLNTINIEPRIHTPDAGRLQFL